MNVKERAEKIWIRITRYEGRKPDDYAERLIAAQIEEAERGVSCHCDDTYAKGFRAAREKAAEILESYQGNATMPPYKGLAERIRRMEDK